MPTYQFGNTLICVSNADDDLKISHLSDLGAFQAIPSPLYLSIIVRVSQTVFWYTVFLVIFRRCNSFIHVVYYYTHFVKPFCVPVQFVKLSLEHFICGNPEQPHTWTVTILFRTQQHNHSVSGLSEHRCRTANSCYFRLVIMTSYFSVNIK